LIKEEKMNPKEHNRMVGIYLMAHGGFQAIVMVILCVIYGVIGGAMLVGGRQGEEKMVGVVFIAMILLIGFIALLFILPQIIGGYKLWKERPNARNWGIVGSIIACLSFPLGTAAGVYGLWFLFGDLGKQFYLGGSPQHAFQNPQAPPPNSWQ
jgi:hypothetical protein